MIGVDVIDHRRGRNRIDGRDRQIVQPNLFALGRPDCVGVGDDVVARLRRRRSASFSIPLISMQARLAGDRFSLSDMAFANALAPLVLPDEYASLLPSFAEMPPVVGSVITEMQSHPAGQFALRIYRDHRGGVPPRAQSPS